MVIICRKAAKSAWIFLWYFRSARQVSETFDEPPRKDITNIHVRLLLLEESIGIVCAQLFLDLHGHSQKMNVSFYGCGVSNIACAVYPKLASKATEDVSFESSRWKFAKAQLKTARSVAYRRFGVINSYTVECSFYGSDCASPPYVAEFDQTRLASIGAALGRAMAAYFQVPVDHRLDPVAVGCEWLHFEDLAGVSPQALLDELRLVAATVHDLPSSLAGDEPTANSDSEDDEPAKNTAVMPRVPSERPKRIVGSRLSIPLRPRARSTLPPLVGTQFANGRSRAVRESQQSNKFLSGRKGFLQGPVGPALAREQNAQPKTRRRRGSRDSGPSGAMNLANGISSRKSYVAAVLSEVKASPRRASQSKGSKQQ